MSKKTDDAKEGGPVISFMTSQEMRANDRAVNRFPVSEELKDPERFKAWLLTLRGSLRRQLEKAIGNLVTDIVDSINPQRSERNSLMTAVTEALQPQSMEQLIALVAAGGLPPAKRRDIIQEVLTPELVSALMERAREIRQREGREPSPFSKGFEPTSNFNYR